MTNVNQFIRAAYQRAQIDRQPVAVYFWNETLRVSSDDAGNVDVVVGKAVAVRRSGRISGVQGVYLIDEFGDLRFSRLISEDDEEDVNEASKSGGGMYLYRLNGEDDVVAIGWEDYLAEGAILAVEWPERAGGLIPPDARHVRFRHLGEEKRKVAIDAEWKNTI